MARLESIGRLLLTALAVALVLFQAVPASAHGTFHAGHSAPALTDQSPYADTLVTPADARDDEAGTTLVGAPPALVACDAPRAGIAIAPALAVLPPAAASPGFRYGRAPPTTFVS